MTDINNSLQSITSIEGFCTWLCDSQTVSAEIGRCGGRRFRQEGCSGSIAIKDLVQKANLLVYTASEKEKNSFDRIVEKIEALNDSATRALKTANCFQCVLTHIRQFFGNWGYCWQKELSLLSELSTAFVILDAALSDEHERIKQFVRANIKEMIETTKKRGSSPPKSRLYDGKRVRLKAGFEDHEFYLYLRVPQDSGNVKTVEQLIVMIGSDVGSYAYYKPVQIYSGRDIQNNFKEMEGEHKHTQGMRDCVQILSMDVIPKHSKKPGKIGQIKALRSAWADRGDLFKLLITQTLTDQERFQLAIDIATALKRIHAGKKVHIATTLKRRHAEKKVHLDLKSENILISKDFRAFVADFGRLDDEGKTLKKIVTTYNCASLEMFSSSWEVKPSADMWAFGIILLELFYGLEGNLYRLKKHMPHTDEEFCMASKFPEIQKTWRTIREKIVGRMKEKECVVRPLIEQLLDFDPDKRPSAEQSLERLNKLAIL